MSEFSWSATFEIAEGTADAWRALIGDEPPMYQVTLDIPARRRSVWEWLTRKPRHAARRIFIPNAILTAQEAQDD